MIRPDSSTASSANGAWKGDLDWRTIPWRLTPNASRPRSGHEGLTARETKNPAQFKIRLTEAGARIVQLYEAWGKPERAAQWRKTLGLGSELPAEVFAP
jgi:hypothetical protein